MFQRLLRVMKKGFQLFFFPGGGVPTVIDNIRLYESVKHILGW